MKKMLFWGHIGNVQKPMNELHHISPARSQAHAEAFSQIGYDVTMAVFHHEGVGTLSPTLRRVHLFDINADDYDIVFLNFRLAINQVYNYSYNLEPRHSRMFKNREKQFLKILAHPNIAIQLDGPRSFTTDQNPVREKELVQHIKHIGISTVQGLKNWKNTWKNNNEFLCLAATISYRPEKGPDPMPNNGRPRVLYLGRLNDAAQISSMDKIEAIAKRLPHIDFVTVSCKVKDRDTGKLITPMLTDPDDITEQKSEQAKRQFTAPNIIYMPGPRYSDTFQYMYHADLGLGFAVRHGQDICSCKMYEYLGSGLPTVVEDATPEASLLDEIDCGKKAKTHSFDDIAAKIEDALATTYNRHEIMSHMLREHTYEKRVLQYHERF